MVVVLGPDKARPFPQPHPRAGFDPTPTPPSPLEPAKQLTRNWQHRKIMIQLTVQTTGEYAGQVLGSARVDAHPPSRELALWRQHLVRRSAPREQPLYF